MDDRPSWFGAGDRQIQPPAAGGSQTQPPPTGGSQTQPPAAGESQQEPDMPWFGAGDLKTPAPEKEPETSLADTAGGLARAAGSGLVKGGIGVAGLPTDLTGYVKEGANRLFDLVLPPRPEWPKDAPKPFTLSDYISTQALQKAYEARFGKSYEPKTTAEKYVKTVGEFLPGSFIGPGGAAIKLAAGVGSALTSELAGQTFAGSKAEPWARVAGSLAGGIGTAGTVGALSSRRAANIATRAEDIAAKSAKEAFTDPSAVAQKLGQGRPGDYVKGVEPTPAQVLGGQEAAGFEGRVSALGTKAGMTEGEAAIRAQKEASKEAFGSQIQGAKTSVPPVDVQTSYGIMGANPQSSAAGSVYSAIDDAAGRMEAAAKGLWEAPELARATVYKNKSIDELQALVNSMPIAQRYMLSPEVQKMITEIKSIPSSQIPFQELQALRSTIGGLSRAAYKNNNDSAGYAHSLLSKKLATILNNEKNIVFGDKTAAARSTWNEARTLTAQIHDLFDPKAIAQLRSGAPEASIQKLFSGVNAPENLRQARKIPNINIDRHVSDWLVGELTKNGSKVVSQADVQRFLANPKYGSLADQIPNLRSRIDQITRRAGESEVAAAARSLSDRFNSLIDNGNPKAIYDFLSASGSSMKAIDPQNARFFDAVQRSAKVLQSTGKPMQPVTTKTIDRLADNNIFTILYGRAAGVLSEGAALAALTNVAQKALNVSLTGAEIAAGAAGVSGITGRATNRITGFFNDIIFSGTREQAIAKLQEAVRDPVVMRALLQKPDKTAAEALGKVLRGISIAGQPAALQKMREEEEPRPLTIRPNREGRATGGSVKGAVNLRALANAARKQVCQSTEDFLKESDDQVAKALEIANQHI